MGYTIKKSAHIVDEINIEDAGKTLKVDVNIYVDDILRDFDKCRKQIGAAQRNIDDLKNSTAAPEERVSQAYAALGESVIALFELLFGADQTKAIVEFYESRHASMLSDFIPYITQVIVPEIQKAQKELAERYKTWKS